MQVWFDQQLASSRKLLIVSIAGSGISRRNVREGASLYRLQGRQSRNLQLEHRLQVLVIAPPYRPLEYLRDIHGVKEHLFTRDLRSRSMQLEWQSASEHSSPIRGFELSCGAYSKQFQSLELYYPPSFIEEVRK